MIAADARPSGKPPRCRSPESADTTSPRRPRSPRRSPPWRGTNVRPPQRPQPALANPVNRVSPSMLAPNPSQHLESETTPLGNPLYDSAKLNRALSAAKPIIRLQHVEHLFGWAAEGGLAAGDDD